MASLNRKQEPPLGIPDAATLAAVIPVVDGPGPRPWHDRQLSTSHADICVRQTTGKRLPILLLHGGGLCKEVFDQQLASPLGSLHRMIAIDLPGHGASSDAFEPKRTYRLEGLADLALEVLECLGIDHAVVVGASLGGWIGLQMIQSFPGLIGLMLSGTGLGDFGDAAFRPNLPSLPELRLWDDGKPSNEQIEAFLRKSLGEFAGVAFAHLVKRADARAMGLVRRDIGLNSIEVRAAADVAGTPIMVVNGATGPAEGGTETAAAEPEGRGARTHHILPQTGPAPYLDLPTVYNDLLERFMRRMVRRERGLLTSPMLWYGG